MDAGPDTVGLWLRDLQQRIVEALESIEGPDGARFVRDPWEKPPGEPLQGRGLTCILENGRVFERAGCGFSHVSGPALPPSATQHRSELAGAPFEAMGVSLVFHPRNPYVPTVHMNVRMLAALPPGQPRHREPLGCRARAPGLVPGLAGRHHEEQVEPKLVERRL
ncbi:MAG: coproporphyrinogen III oxidase, partial [Comamonadaceae bacterium]